jgi:hypothetical protein
MSIFVPWGPTLEPHKHAVFQQKADQEVDKFHLWHLARQQRDTAKFSGVKG